MTPTDPKDKPSIGGLFDRVITNPPFGLQDVEQLFGLRTTSRERMDSTLQYIKLTLASLAPDGTANILVPDGFLSSVGDALELRQRLIEAGQIEAVVRLPTKLFEPYANIRVSFLLLRKRGRVSTVRIIDATDRDFGRPNAKGATTPFSLDLKSVEGCPSGEVTNEQLAATEWDLSIAPPIGEPPWLEGTAADPWLTKVKIELLGHLASLMGGTVINHKKLCTGNAIAATVPYLRAQDVSKGIVKYGEKWATTEALAEYKHERLLLLNDILLSRSGTIGKIGRVQADTVGAAVSGALHIIRPDASQIDPEFLAAYLQSASCQSWLSARAGGSVIITLRLSTLGTLRVPIPERSLQRLAAQRFGEWGVDVLKTLAKELGIE